ncbi:hypothetical protein WICPIJ_005025 [Wickerhamomyces pijperi]|uniref:Plasma membrane proteolipid 3 n=1 Tax=Wickerhamomyces pijperi TaxID=599730 RepID=A0A9P8Q4B5_WICPI|nr:hypothetical protein WICPIJ_005025 [Wickerhamomyces pijperi]
MHSKDWFLVFIAIFLPPVPVLIKRGFFSADFAINILLLILGFFPGLLHALYIISEYPYTEAPGGGLTGNASSGYGAV